MNLNDKVNFILSKFNDPKEFERYGIDKKYRAKIWNIDTSILTILKRMNQKVKDISVPIDIITVKKTGVSSTGESRFSFFIGNINVTPSTMGIVSLGASRQYLQILSSLGIVMFGNTKGKYLENDFKVAANFKSMLNSDYDLDMTQRLISFCLKRNIAYSRNLAVSLFLCSLRLFKFDFKNIDLENRKVEKRMRKDVKKFFDLASKYGDNYLDKCLDETYGKFLEYTLKNESIENFINGIFNIIQNQDDDNDSIILNQEITKQIELANYLNSLKTYRSKFKNNIKKNREELRLFDPQENLYSDIITIENDMDGLASRFNELQAAHIYNIWQIKEDLIKVVKEYESEINNNEQIEEVIKSAENPNNGLMMNIQYHDYFDRNLFTFNEKGEMIYRDEDKKYLFETLKLKEVRINPKILNNEMKHFLSIRKF
ncbi:MAG: MAG4270 family putative restriction endonuclease [Metamycoplasmataceae bacterium]